MCRLAGRLNGLPTIRFEDELTRPMIESGMFKEATAETVPCSHPKEGMLSKLLAHCRFFMFLNMRGGMHCLAFR